MNKNMYMNISKNVYMSENIYVSVRIRLLMWV